MAIFLSKDNFDPSVAEGGLFQQRTNVGDGGSIVSNAELPFLVDLGSNGFNRLPQPDFRGIVDGQEHGDERPNR